MKFFVVAIVLAVVVAAPKVHDDGATAADVPDFGKLHHCQSPPRTMNGFDDKDLDRIIPNIARKIDLKIDPPPSDPDKPLSSIYYDFDEVDTSDWCSPLDKLVDHAQNLPSGRPSFARVLRPESISSMQSADRIAGLSVSSPKRFRRQSSRGASGGSIKKSSSPARTPSTPSSPISASSSPSPTKWRQLTRTESDTSASVSLRLEMLQSSMTNKHDECSSAPSIPCSRERSPDERRSPPPDTRPGALSLLMRSSFQRSNPALRIPVLKPSHSDCDEKPKGKTPPSPPPSPPEFRTYSFPDLIKQESVETSSGNPLTPLCHTDRSLLSQRNQESFDKSCVLPFSNEADEDLRKEQSIIGKTLAKRKPPSFRRSRMMQRPLENDTIVADRAASDGSLFDIAAEASTHPLKFQEAPGDLTTTTTSSDDDDGVIVLIVYLVVTLGAVAVFLLSLLCHLRYRRRSNAMVIFDPIQIDDEPSQSIPHRRTSSLQSDWS